MNSSTSATRLCLLILALAVSGPGTAAGKESAGAPGRKAKNTPHYVLVMSRDDGLCRPLTALFDRDLQRDLAELRKRPADAPDDPGSLVFPNYQESDLQGLENLGIVKYPRSFSKTGHSEYNLSLNNGGMSYLAYKLEIQGVDFSAFRLFILRDQALSGNALEEALSDLANPDRDSPSLLYPKADWPVLKQWPNDTTEIKEHTIDQMHLRPPEMDKLVFDEVFSYQNRALFISNQGWALNRPSKPSAKNSPSSWAGYIVRVYRIDRHFDPDDICYLSIELS